MAVVVRAYLSPTLVLLAFDWPQGKGRDDFLGFAIKRTPGFFNATGTTREPVSWLPTVVRAGGSLECIAMLRQSPQRIGIEHGWRFERRIKMWDQRGQIVRAEGLVRQLRSGR